MHKMCKECAHYDHKNLKHTIVCHLCVTQHHKDGTESDPSKWKALPPTNADRIRAMSDEELAEYIDSVAEACYNAGAEDLPLSNSNPLSNAYNILEWLKQPAEE